MPLLRSSQENPSEISPFKQTGELVPEFPSEALNGFEEQKLKNMGNTAQEIIFVNLGISLDDKEAILGMLTGFQEQIDKAQKDFADDYEAYEQYQETIIEPQGRTLNALLNERLPHGWKAHGPSIWADSSVILEKGNKEVQIFLNENGFQLLTETHDIYWKEMPGKEKSVYITFIQEGTILGQPAPICTIKSNTEHWDLGVLSLYRTQDHRVAKAPYFGDIISSQAPLSHVVYSKTGDPKYIEVRVPIHEPGLSQTGKQLPDTTDFMLYTYDLSQGLTTGIAPAYTRVEGNAVPLHTDAYPEIVVDDDSIMVSLGNREDFFPLKIEGGMMKIAKDGLEAMERLHPPRSKRVKIIDRLTQASPKLKSIFKKSLLEDE